MGYSTGFTGHVTVTPALNGPEMDYLRRFAQSRRYDRADGPYQTGTLTPARLTYTAPTLDLTAEDPHAIADAAPRLAAMLDQEPQP